MARRRYHRRQRSSSDAEIATGILAFIVFAGLVAKQKLDPAAFILFTTLLGGVAVIAIAGAICFAFYRHTRTLQKLRALEVVDMSKLDPRDFEKYVAEVLKAQGYTNVALTEYYDLGIDITAEKDGTRWGIQVKRYSSLVPADAVRQVVTALKKYRCQRAMVVTNSYYSRPARELASSNNCILIDRDKLAEWIVAFQNGR
jgi:restriction system protein